MKRIYIKKGLLALASFLAFAFVFFNSIETTATKTDIVVEEGEFPTIEAADYAIERYAFPTGASTVDTLTNAGNDTLTIPVNLFSLWNYNWTVQATNISGTTSIIAILQEKNYYGTANWYEVERDTISATGDIRLSGLYGDGTGGSGLVEGQNQRLILDGSGTQSTQYKVWVTLKK